MFPAQKISWVGLWAHHCSLKQKLRSVEMKIASSLTHCDLHLSPGCVAPVRFSTSLLQQAGVNTAAHRGVIFTCGVCIDVPGSAFQSGCLPVLKIQSNVCKLNLLEDYICKAWQGSKNICLTQRHQGWQPILRNRAELICHDSDKDVWRRHWGRRRRVCISVWINVVLPARKRQVWMKHFAGCLWAWLCGENEGLHDRLKAVITPCRLPAVRQPV